MMDLSTTYMGMRLRTPLVVSASPLSEDMEHPPHGRRRRVGHRVVFAV